MSAQGSPEAQVEDTWPNGLCFGRDEVRGLAALEGSEGTQSTSTPAACCMPFLKMAGAVPIGGKPVGGERWVLL